MVKVCKQCGKEFEAVRDTATYCSAKCRKQSQRLAGQKEVLAGQKEVLAGQDDTLKVSVPDNKLSGTNTPKINNEQKQLNLPDIERIQISDSKVIPNWQRIGLKANEVKEYIIWHLKKSGILDYSVIVIGNKMFGNYKEEAKEMQGEVKAFRADISV